MKNKHLSFDERLEIERGLKENLSFKQLQKILKKIALQFQKKSETI